MQLKYIFIVLSLLLCLTLIDAQDYGFGKVRSGECIQLIQPCTNCTFVSIDSIQYPNSSIALSNINMSINSSNGYYTFCDTTTSGEYVINGKGDIDGLVDPYRGRFLSSKTGDLMDQPKLTMNIIIIIICFIVFIGLLILGIYLPSKDKKDEIMEEEAVYHPELVLNGTLCCYCYQNYHNCLCSHDDDD
jgi:hypothetical protein